MCDACTRGFVWGGTPTGKEQTIGGLSCYVASPSAAAHKAVLFITDIFGFSAVNARLLAGHYAEAGCTVVIPDLLGSDAFTHEEFASKTPADRMASLNALLAKHSDELTLEQLTKVSASLRAELGVQKLAVLGFCWGGRHAALLGAGAAGGCDVAIIAHPSRVSAAEISHIQKPVLLLAAETDSAFPEASVATVEAAVAGREDVRVMRFPGTEHGFAVRGDSGNDVTKAAMAEAAKAVVEWLRARL